MEISIKSEPLFLHFWCCPLRGERERGKISTAEIYQPAPKCFVNITVSKNTPNHLDFISIRYFCRLKGNHGFA